MVSTLLQYRRSLAQALDDGGLYTASSGTTATVQLPGLVSGATGISDNTYDGRWVYISSGSGATQQAVVRVGGYDSLTGVLTVDPPWTAPASGSVVHITGLFPSIAQVQGEDTSYRDIINRTLRLLLVPDRVSLAVTTSDSYSLSAWPWLDRDERLVRVLEPSARSGRRPVSAQWRGPSLVLNGELPTLELNAPFSAASGSMVLEVLRPGDTWINAAESASGLTSDTDTAVPSVEDVTVVGLMLAYQALMSRSPGRPSGNYAGKYDDARTEARKLRLFDRTREIDAPAMPVQGAA